MKSFEQMVRIASNYVGVFPESQKAFLNEIENSVYCDYSFDTDYSENYNSKFNNSEVLRAFENELEIESSNNTDYENKMKTEKQEITKTNLKFMNPDFLNSFEKTVNFN